jgi:molecular chaperone DnaK (HSP70)
MPAIRAQLRRLTPHGPPPVSINPEETTACGAAIQAAALAGPPDAAATRALTAMTVAPHAIREPLTAELGGLVAAAAGQRAEDGVVRELIGARHALGEVTGRVERLLRERGDSLPNGETHRAWLLLREARDAVHVLALERVLVLTSALRTTMASLASRRNDPIDDIGANARGDRSPSPA